MKRVGNNHKTIQTVVTELISWYPEAGNEMEMIYCLGDLTI